MQVQVFTMSCDSKEKMERNFCNKACKSHPAKSDRDMYRVCPSKLSKRELEDLYFTLLENNLELKKAMNGQQDKIRVLSTQVQRMTNTHDKIMSKEMRESSTSTKAFVNEQKDFITELKETNQRMAERIQQLNMRLCSAKQFSKTTPPLNSNSRRFRPATASPPKRHNCLNKDQGNEQVLKLSTSSQWEDRTPGKTTQTHIVPLENHNSLIKDQGSEVVLKFSASSQWEDRTPGKTTQTVIVPLEKKPTKSDQPCDENKCRSLMEEMKIKIITLQDELFNVNDEYSTRIGRLETEVSEVRKENIRIISERSASEHELQNTVKRTSDVLAQYRLSEAKCSELTTELAIEKRKVAELETQLKAANMSDKVNKTIEDHLTTIQTILPPSPPKKRDSDDLLAKTVHIPSKSSSGTSQQLSKSTPTKTISEETNCETCGCKPQLTSDPVPVHSPTPTDETNCETCGCKTQLTSDPAHSPTSADHCKCDCPPPTDLSTQAKNIKCCLCDCVLPKNTSTPLKAKKKNVECRCPAWVNSAILKPPAAQFQDVNAKCIKCCFKDEHDATESLPSKNGTFHSPREATTRWSPSKDKDDTKSSKTGDDSGYQDTDELGLFKQNRELMTTILELQNQIDRMKIRMSEMSEAKPASTSESTGSPKNTTDNAAVATAAVPLFGVLKKMSELPEPVPDKRSFADDDTATTSNNFRPFHREFAQVQFSPKMSVENVRGSEKILSIEILGDPKEPVRALSWDDTRAKTIEDADGTLKITEEPFADKFRPLDLMNYDYPEQNKIDFPKLKIIEKKKFEIPTKKLEPGNLSLKSVTSSATGHGFNPEKLKYLEAEGIIAKPQLGEDMSKLQEDLGSLTESVPSNPELGFSILRLASKASQEKYKAESDFRQQARDDLMGVLHSKLKLPMAEALVANNSTAPKQTDEKKKPEDCQYCAACTFDKECELKHENAANHRINRLAPEMQKRQVKKHDQHNSLQIPGPIPTSDSQSNINKREKMRNLFSHFIKSRSSKEKKEETEQQTTAATDGPANLPDVPLLDEGQLGTDSIKIDKRISTHDKKDKSIKQKKGSLCKEDLSVNPKKYPQNVSTTTDGPISLPDVPLLDKREDSQDVVEGKPSRIAFSIDNDLDPPLLEVNIPTDHLHSERMLPTLASTKVTYVERKADVVQSSDQKLAGKANQAPTTIESCRKRDVSLYRRRSGSLRYRPLPAGPEPPVCRCIGQQDGYCTDKLRKKEDVKSPRDKYRALLTSEHGTYTVSSKQTDPSSDCTDLDLSDLPMEKEKKTSSKTRLLSPGEEKTTTFTNTHSYYSPPTNTSLSDGEIPATTMKPKHSESDIGLPYLNPTLAHKLETPPSQQMEAALQAISDELRRCTNVLQAQRPAEWTQSALQSSPEVAPPIALRPGVATQGIGNKYAPMSIFTLHIGTIVLSDEAVLKSRDKDLVLKWKFYDQNVSMARMPPGRVAVFDFSTEYDIRVTEDFLHYLKHEEMPIVICELDQEEEYFASCVLPLRDALLHTNTRADMSLALMAGPDILNQRANNGEVDTINAGDEVGVIDLWCLMRADANMLPGINLAIAQPQPGAAPRTQRHSRVMTQVLDDYNELDLTMGKAGPVGASSLTRSAKNLKHEDVEYNRTSNTWGKARGGRTKKAKEASVTQTIPYDPSKYPPLRERKLTAPVASPPQQDHGAQEGQRESKIIVTVVNPQIKSPGDISQAMERNQRIYDIRSIRSDDQYSQTPSSYGSIKSVLSRLQKRGSRYVQTDSGEQHSFIEKLRKASLNKAEQSKKVTILPKYTEIEESIRTGEPENQKRNTPKLEITVLWLALNEECEAMIDTYVQRVYVAYTFLGRSGAELETPVSLPKPKHYVDKCYFNFKKVFELSHSDLLKLQHMGRCRAGSQVIENEKDCIIFSVVSEPTDDPLGIENCEDIGYAYLYLGDLLAYSAGSPGYTEVMPVRAAHGPDNVCGVLAVRIDGLDVVRRCLLP